MTWTTRSTPCHDISEYDIVANAHVSRNLQIKMFVLPRVRRVTSVKTLVSFV